MSLPATVSNGNSMCGNGNSLIGGGPGNANGAAYGTSLSNRYPAQGATTASTATGIVSNQLLMGTHKKT